MKRMKRSEFIQWWANNKGLTLLDALDRRVALPCNCGWAGCEGWAMVMVDWDTVESHLLYSWKKPDE